MSAIGRAPIVKMSRRMPPAPVAAPWYGSMADGWLWLSMRMAAAIPSPTSTTPAFSPGPTSTQGASVGSRDRCRRDDLYEQCSDHMTANMASSRWFGSRPRMRSMSTASSSVSPSARWIGAAIHPRYKPAMERHASRLELRIPIGQTMSNGHESTSQDADVR